MLPSQNKLPLSSELERIQKEGKVFQGRLFGLIVSPREKGSSSRFAFIVSTKVAKKANVRNRAKRLLREATRKNLELVKKPIDGIFLAKKSLAGKTYAEVEEDVVRIFNKVSR